MLPREQYPPVINTQLQQIEFEIEKLRNEISRSGDEAKSEYSELVTVLDSKLNQAKQKLNMLEQVSDDEWYAAKTDLDNTLNALKSMWSDAASKITT